MKIAIPPGSNLSTLATQYKTTVPELLKLNPNITNPDFIKSGASLTIPDAQGQDPMERSLPVMDKTLDNAGGGIPERDLPDASKSPMVRFSSVLNDALDFAKSKRRRLTQGVYDATVPKGALPASSFADFIRSDENAGTQFTQPLVDTAMDAFKADESTIAKDKEAVQNIALKVSEATGNSKLVEEILSMGSNVEGALVKAAAHLKKKTTGGGDSDGSSYSPEDLRTLRQAGLASNTDQGVKNLFLNTPPEFRADFTRNYAQGGNQNVDVNKLSQTYKDWVAEQERLKKQKSSTAEDIEALFAD